MAMNINGYCGYYFSCIACDLCLCVVLRGAGVLIDWVERVDRNVTVRVTLQMQNCISIYCSLCLIN